jgi:Spy/CpxP family protein refolding chaperone
MKKLMLTALALGLSLTAALAQEPPQGRPGPAGKPGAFRQRMEDRMDAALGLTDAQKTSMHQIREKHRTALEAKRKAAMTSRRAFFEALRNADAKVEDLKGLHRAQADADLDLLLENRAQSAEVRALLTPDQRERFGRMEGRMMDGMGKGMPMGRRPHMGAPR